MAVDTAAPVARPEQLSANPLRRLAGDALAEWRGRGTLPAGPGGLQHLPHPADRPRPVADPALLPMRSTGRSSACASSTAAASSCSAPRPTTSSPSPTRRTSTGASRSFGDLIPLLGDGLLTIDDDYHDRARAIMMPAFHREQVAALAGVDGRRGRGGDRPPASRRGRRPLRLDAQPGDADRDAGPARARSRRAPARAPPRPSTSSAPSASTGSTSRCACCAARARPGAR